MHPEMTARGDGQLAPAATSAIPAVLEATPHRHRAVSPAAINYGCTLRSRNTTIMLPAPVAIACGWHWPWVAWQQAAGGISGDRECWGEAPGRGGAGLRQGGTGVAIVNGMGGAGGVFI